jgi:MerR family transcriptional regulator, heat shock protein HspR
MRQAPGIYMISVVADTLDMHPQTLRKYERAGFIEPLRMGTLRAYSDEDVARLRLIKHFVEDLGLNLAGVELALKLTSDLLSVRAQLTSKDDDPEAEAKSLAQIDSMLGTLGLRVVQQPEEKAPQLPGPGDGWFTANPGEAVELNDFARKEAAKQE